MYCLFLFVLLFQRGKQFTADNPWGTAITQSTNIAELTVQSIVDCSYNCIMNPLCHAFTCSGQDCHHCTLHDKLLQVDYITPVAQEGATYYQPVSRAKSCDYDALFSTTLYNIMLEINVLLSCNVHSAMAIQKTIDTNSMVQYHFRNK